jgi:hypothetical protein
MVDGWKCVCSRRRRVEGKFALFESEVSSLPIDSPRVRILISRENIQ